MDSPADKPKLACPTCAYDLHGLEFDRKGSVRCPECGELTDIMGMVREHQRRVQDLRQMSVALMAFLVLFALFTFTPRGWLRLDQWTAMKFALALLISTIYAARYLGLSWPWKMMISLVLTTSLVLPQLLPGTLNYWSFILFPLVFCAVHIWAVDREMKEASL
jgi:hypothetical protein